MENDYGQHQQGRAGNLRVQWRENHPKHASTRCAPDSLLFRRAGLQAARVAPRGGPRGNRHRRQGAQGDRLRERRPFEDLEDFSETSLEYEGEDEKYEESDIPDIEFGHIKRTIPLPKDADMDSMTASSSNGILVLTTGRKDISVKSRKIKVSR